MSAEPTGASEDQPVAEDNRAGSDGADPDSEPTVQLDPRLGPPPAAGRRSVPRQVSGWPPRWPASTGQPYLPYQFAGRPAPPTVGPMGPPAVGPTSAAPTSAVLPPRRWPAGSGPHAAGQWPPVLSPVQRAASFAPTAVPRVSWSPAPTVDQLGNPVLATDGAAAITGKKASDKLTLSKVLAGGMAAATSAVLGSYFGALGTVGGAAVGSIATTVATNVYQRSLERTRELTLSRARSAGGRPRDGATDSAQLAQPVWVRPVEQQPTVRLEAGRAARSLVRSIYRSLAVLAAGTALIFALGLAMVSGIEWAKGSPLSGGTSGTSVGRVLAPEPRPAPTTQPDVVPDEDRSSSEPGSETPSSEENSSRRGGPLNDLFPSSSSRPVPSPSGSERPTRSEGLLPSLGEHGVFQPNQ
jgi:hypothetical protein